MDEKDVVADVFTKVFSCGSDVPNAKLFWVFLRMKQEVMGVETYMVAEQVSVFTN